MQTKVEHIDIEQQKTTLRERGICVIIPTYNNVGSITDVVARTKEQCLDVIVVCDGCTDGTQQKVEEIEDITIVSYAKNKGKGEALKQGFMKALSMGFAYAITLDADGQHFPEDIHLLLEANIKHPGALIIGQRKGLENVERSAGSKFANGFSNFWFCVQTGQYLQDTQTGYRLYPLKKLHGLNFLTSRYEAELELLVFARWHGVELVSTPVNVYYPPKEERVSHFRPGLDFTRISILNTILCILALVYGLPLKIIRSLLTFCRTFYSLLAYLISCFLILIPGTIFAGLFNTNKKKKSAWVRGLLYKVTKTIIYYHGIPGVKYTIDNKANEDFSRPAVVICNHQSHLDLMVMLSQTKKLIVLTKDWAWNSPFFGWVIRNAEYYPVSMGFEKLLPQLKALIDDGYSIAVYPEGTRSADCHIARFHKGAFLLAEELKLDILPFIEYGPGLVLPKGGTYLRKGQIKLQIDKRISYDEYSKIGSTKEIASWFRKYYKKEYSSLSNRLDQDA